MEYDCNVNKKKAGKCNPTIRYWPHAGLSQGWPLGQGSKKRGLERSEGPPRFPARVICLDNNTLHGFVTKIV